MIEVDSWRHPDSSLVVSSSPPGVVEEMGIFEISRFSKRRHRPPLSQDHTFSLFGSFVGRRGKEIMGLFFVRNTDRPMTCGGGEGGAILGLSDEGGRSEAEKAGRPFFGDFCFQHL